MPRIGRAQRCTDETEVSVRLELDTRRDARCDSGLPFFDHMLSAMTFHAGFGLDLTARGDLEVGGHHLVEDVGLVLGTALAQAVGRGEGITRFGHAFVPMDEALVAAFVDVGGRAFLGYEMAPPERRFGAFHTDLLPEFFRAMCTNAGITLHLRQDAGVNAHHISEAAFKAVGRALRVAVSLDEADTIPSTKGVIG